MISLTSAQDIPVMDQAAAEQFIEAARSDPKHELWSRSPEAQRELYLKAYPGPVAGFGGTVRLDSPASAPIPATSERPGSLPAPSWPPPREEASKKHSWTLQAEAEEELARRRQTLGADNRTILTLGAKDTPPEEPEAQEQPPVSVADGDLPAIRLPEGVSADDPVVRGVRQLGVLAEVAPPAVEGLVAHVHGLLQTEPPDEEDYWKQSDAALATAQQKYGPRFTAFLDAVQRGRSFVEEHEPALVEVLEDPMVQKDLRTAEILAHIGSQGRRLYVRKYGTKPLFRL